MKNKSIIIKGSKWSIKYLRHDHPSLEGNNGLTKYAEKLILISKTPDVAIKNVYWHEYLHAFFWECGIRDLDTNFEHALIENLADLLERVDK